MKTGDMVLENRFGHRDLYPVYYGFEDCKPGHMHGMIRNCYLVHCVLEGCGVFRVGGGEYPVTAGQVFLIYPGQSISYQADTKTPWSYVWIGFDGELAEKLRALPCQVQNTSAVDDFRRLREEIGLHAVPELSAVACLHRMFADLLDVPGKKDYITRAENEIESKYMLDISVSSLAASFSLDRRYLSRLFREKRGITLGQHIIGVRIEKAKRLLREGIPVLRVAELVGYPDYTAFSRLFRLKVGKSPRSYVEKSLTNISETLDRSGT